MEKMFKTIKTNLGKLTLVLMLFISSVFSAQAQKSGLIYQSAGTGAAVLDPDGNGYTSQTTAGFTTSDYTESEIAYRPIPQLQTEPNADLATGPSCGFTDFVDDGSEYSAGAYFDGTNLLFRFRLAGTANNSKGYSILIDTDQKMGAYGEHQDPNYTPGNPGFEIEVVLETNFGVYLYDVDGTTSPTQKGTPLAYANYCQKSIAQNLAGTITCGGKYFYDFYIPFSVIQTYFPAITTSTPLRFVANTVIAPKSALQGPLSDIQGVNDKNYASADLAWTAAINNIYPTSVSGINTGFGSDRSLNIPSLLSPIAVGATAVSVTVTAGGVIKIYKEGTSTPVCSTPVVTAGTYSVGGCTSFLGGDRVYATLTETGKSESETSNTVMVVSCSLGASTTPAAPVTAQNEKKLTGTCISGATVKLYNSGSFYANANVTGTTWEYVFGTNGNGLIPCGTWQVSQTELNKCESMLSDPYCQSVSSGGGSACSTTYTQTATPTITGPLYNTDKVIEGTTVANATVYIYQNNTFIKSVTTTTSTSTAWTLSGLTLSTGDIITVRALASGSGFCRSNGVASTIIQAVSIAPVVTSPILAGATTIRGTSIEPAGSTITVYVNAVSAGTTTVQSDGSWSKTVTAVATGNTVYATAQGTGKTVSVNSSTVTVSASAETVTPTITGTYHSGDLTVSGTLPAGILASTTYTIVLYEDGYAIDTFTKTTAASTATTTSWTSNSLHSTASYWDYLYVGGTLTAKAYRSGTSTEGSSSNSVVVLCSSPVAKTFSATSSYLQSAGTATINVTSSELNVVYTLTDVTGTTIIGNSKVGTGGTVVLTTNSITTTTTFYVRAEKVEAGSCSLMMSGSATITVDKEAVYTNNTTSHVGVYTNGYVLASVTDADGTGSAVVSASLTSGTLPPGTALNTSTGAITVTNLGNVIPGTYNFTITTTDKQTGNIGSTANALTMNFTPAALPVELLSFTAAKMTDNVILNWATATEINNSHFDIQRSNDGKTWKTIGKVLGNGNSKVVINYSYMDKTASSAGMNTLYYRLNQVDYNGDHEYSMIRAVSFGGAAKIEAYPNPVRNALNVSFDIAETGTATLQVVNAEGVLLFTELIAEPGKANKQLDMANYPAGIYFVRIITATDVTTARIIKN